MFKSIKIKSVLLLATISASPAFADGGSNAPNNGMDQLFAAVSLQGTNSFITTTGVAIIGINLALKGITLAKRAIAKA